VLHLSNVTGSYERQPLIAKDRTTVTTLSNGLIGTIQDPTLRPGYKPAKHMEKTTMYGMPSILAYDLALAAQNDKLARASHVQLVLEATKGQHSRFQPFKSIRRGFGSALIALGQSVHGERIDQQDHSSVPSTGTLRMAR